MSMQSRRANTHFSGHADQDELVPHLAHPASMASRSYSAMSAHTMSSSPISAQSALTASEMDKLLSPTNYPYSESSPYPPTFLADFDTSPPAGHLEYHSAPTSASSGVSNGTFAAHIAVTSHPGGSQTPMSSHSIRSISNPAFPSSGVGLYRSSSHRVSVSSMSSSPGDIAGEPPNVMSPLTRRRSRAKAASGGSEAIQSVSSLLMRHSKTDRSLNVGDDDIVDGKPPTSVFLRTLSLSAISAPSALLLRFRSIVRSKIFPSIRHRVVRNMFLNRMTARLGTQLDGVAQGLDVWSLVGQVNGLATFRSRVQARLTKQTTEELRRNTSEEIMTSMFKSLQTFHHLMDVHQMRMNSDLSKGDALKNILSTVYGLLDCEQVTLFLVDESGQNLKVAWTHNSNATAPSFGPGTAYAHVKKHVDNVVLKEKGLFTSQTEPNAWFS